MSRFEVCLDHLLASEGGYVDHPADPGGATNLGVTLKTWAAWVGRDVAKAEIKALTVADVAPLYRARYWRATSCDSLPPGVDYMVFDLAVNSGPGRAGRFLQMAVGAKADGDIGPATLAKVSTRPPKEIVRAMDALRGDFYRDQPTFPTFGKGWLSRLASVTKAALAMAA